MNDNDELEGNGLADEEIEETDTDDESDAIQHERNESSSPRDNI